MTHGAIYVVGPANGRCLKGILALGFCEAAGGVLKQVIMESAVGTNSLAAQD